MRLLIPISFIFLLSCSSKYNGLHNNLDKFKEDIAYCLNKTCNKYNTSRVFSFSIIPSLHAYGGGGGGGGMGNSSKRISFRAFNLCMNKKGYYKDDKGIFEMPALTCSKD